MKNITKKILVSFFATIALASSITVAYAADPILVVAPDTLTKTIGETFHTSIVVNTTGQAVYAVEGTIVFDNLICKNITVAEGLVVQSTPTCANPYFLVGIPNGTTIDKSLVTVSLSAPHAGNAHIVLSSVDIIGEGVSLSKASAGGNYIINVAREIQKDITVSGQEPTIVTPGVTKASTSTSTITSPEVPSLQVENNQKNFLATIFGAFAGFISQKMFLLLALIVVIIFVGTLYYRNKKEQI